MLDFFKAALGFAALAVGITLLALCTSCKSAAVVAIDTALETSYPMLDAAERAEGDRAIDKALSAADAEAALALVRDRYRPAWVALAAVLSAALGYAEGAGTEGALVTAWCVWTKVSPTPMPDLTPVVRCDP